MFKPSRRAFGIATLFTLSAVCFAPAASAGLLGGSDGGNGNDALPLSGDLLAPVQDLLGSSVGVGGLFGLAPIVEGATGLGGLTNLGGLTDLGSLPAIEGVGLPGLGGADGAGGELVDGAFEAVGGTTLACDAAIPQVLQAFLGDVAGSLCEFNPFESGVAGLLGSL